MNSFFKDLKVVELANVLAGPTVGMFFAELGAEVIKIENSLSGGDVTRTWKMPSEDLNNSTSNYYDSVNWGKQTIFADFSQEAGRNTIYDLIKKADIVISSYKKSDDVKLGMDYETIKSIKPDIIYGHISGYGKENDKVAYDLVLQAETGFMSMNGSIESGPIKMPVALIDVLAAHQLKEALLIGLMNKLKTGKGSFFTVSLFNSAIASLVNQASNYLNSGEVPGLYGSLHPNIAPYGEIFKSNDNKDIVLAIGSDKQFQNLCKILSVPELYSDERFNVNRSRVVNRDVLYSILEKELLKFNSTEFLEQCNKNKVPTSLINNLKNVFELQETQKMLLTYPNKRKCVSTIAFQQH